jgi:hypothetical protein
VAIGALTAAERRSIAPNTSFRLQIQDRRQHFAENGVLSVGVPAVTLLALVAVVVAPPESFAEVVAVIVRIDVTALVAVIGVLIGIRVSVARFPTVLAVRFSGAKSFVVTELDRPLEHPRAVLVRFVVPATARVSVARRGVEIWILPVVVLALALETLTLLPHPLCVLLLEPPLRRSPLAFEFDRLVVQSAILSVELALILRQTLLLQRDPTTLLLFREAPLLVATLLLLLFGLVASLLVPQLILALLRLRESLVVLVARRILPLFPLLVDLVLLLGLTPLYLALLLGLMLP